jgi:hypothetical protein
MTNRVPIRSVDEPPRSVLRDARAAFDEPRVGRLLPIVSGFEQASPSSVFAVSNEVEDNVVMLRDDDIVAFVWCRRVPSGMRLVTEIFESSATATARLRRPAERVSALVSRGRGRFESPTVPGGPACLVIDTNTGALVNTWHSEWLTL